MTITSFAAALPSLPTRLAHRLCYNACMNIIYADTLFALSVFMDYLLLLVTARFCSLRLRRWRYFAAAVLGGVYAVAVFLPGLSWLAYPLCELCAAGFMGLIAFGGEEKLFRCCAAFLAVSASFGGAAWAVCMQYPGRDMPNPGLLIGVFLGSYAVLTLLSYTRRRRARQHLAAVTLALGPQSASFTALEDSGNCLGSVPRDALPLPPAAMRQRRRHSIACRFPSGRGHGGRRGTAAAGRNKRRGSGRWVQWYCLKRR